MQQTTVAKGTDQASLVVFDPTMVRQELQLVDPKNIQVDPSQDQALSEMAEKYVEQLLNVGSTDFQSQEKSKSAVENIGYNLQRDAAHRSKMLQDPIRKLSQRGEDGGEVAKSLIDLKLKVEELDPGKFDFEPGWITRLLGFIPGVGTSLKRYFTQYESAQTVIDAIIRSLENGREQLKRDNKTLSEDQAMMRELTLKLDKTIKLAQLIDQNLEHKLEYDILSEDPKHKFIQEELRFPLLQRTQDLQQQLAVNQQGFLAIEIIIRNNRELIRGVNRAIDVTVSALQVAVTVAMALANQRIVLDKINAINTTTSNLISNTAERLKTQGVEVHKQASTAQLNMEDLKSAFHNINAAMEDISRFRQQALPQMAKTILEMDQMTTETERAIQKLEEGNRVAPSIVIDIE